MEFIINLPTKSMSNFMQLIGYQSIHFEKKGEFSMLRSIDKSNYPKFHLYGRRTNGTIILRLHIDKKETLHENLLDIIGFHDDDRIRVEVERIQKLLKESTIDND